MASESSSADKFTNQPKRICLISHLNSIPEKKKNQSIDHDEHLVRHAVQALGSIEKVQNIAISDFLNSQEIKSLSIRIFNPHSSMF
jgi:hypothetical protein